MTQNNAFKLIQSYVHGWKENSISKVLEPLASDCEIIESHGPIYRGVDNVKKWVEVWLQSNGKVNQWDITSFYFVDDIATFEWVFGCIVDNKTYHIEGISIVHFKDNKISYLREYRMTKPAFKWNEEKNAD